MSDFSLHPNFPVTFNADGMATVHNADFIADPKFAEAYRLGLDTNPSLRDSGVGIQWRVYICCAAAAHGASLGGDFVECGVNTGIISRAVMSYIDFAAMRDRHFFLLDTFRGIPVEQLTAEEADAGEIAAMSAAIYDDCYDAVVSTFAALPNAVIVRGTVPETLPEITSDRICFASIDMNSVAPEIAAGEFLWPRMVSGAIIVLDDYGWRPLFRQKQAWDRFAAERGTMVMALPTGQGLLFKS